MSADVKPIQATPTLNGKDIMQIIKQVALKDIIPIQWSEDVLDGNKKVIITKSL